MEISRPLYILAAQPKTRRDNPARPPNPYKNAIFDSNNVRKYFVKIDGDQYPKVAVDINYSENKRSGQYGDLEIFYKEFNRGSLLNLFVSDLDMKTFYPIQIFDLRLQIEYVTLKKGFPKNINLLLNTLFSM